MRALALRIHLDERGLVGKIAVVWVIILAVLAVFVLDGVAVLTAKYHVADAAGNAVSEAAFTYKQTLKVEDACAKAAETVASVDAEAHIPPNGCFVNTKNGSVTITVKRLTNTLLVKRLSFLADLAKASATETATAPI